ncbi:coiled-coil and C2 domain-containing protein 1A-like isoform X1 [Acipenser ruthenus]|uniref:coiled-coil and C2 domain-containing protein 1A-like isoform X1 n=1 Tax=Acipenser ruthenus TaxID=7906 RepID=UPI00274093C6|nr:coiled-coil and C2 domain-containing protein 1A-like isoform X1 [Acipenser ruthenus]XP_058862985.1 coiled-coil and C2 domain-containing protein 1A-like isoform X1 [Acipenser ruthenus]XP_058862986.1 coiled-coil and C2 domain-containing protein 1A-like isoform X1 [Acipenser ruthenus]
MNRKAAPPRPKGQGAAAARQMGLLLDFSPEAMAMGAEGEGDAELEDELLALVREKPAGGREPGHEGKTPLPMADIERMAALCMRDLDEEEEDSEGLEEDEDLMAELSEVLEDEAQAAPPPVQARPPPAAPITTSQARPSSGGVESTLSERISMYRSAAAIAKSTGESSRARRYERGLKTLESMLASVKKGRSINEEEIPPPVATGNTPAPAPSQSPEAVPAPIPTPPAVITRSPSPPAPDYPPVLPKPPQTLPKPSLLAPPPHSLTTTPDTPLISPLTPVQSTPHSGVKSALLSRQREYKLAALQAKQSGDSELARRHYSIAKRFDPVLEAVDRGKPVDLSNMPPPPDQAVTDRPAPPTQQSTPPAAPPAADSAPPPAPRDLSEALQQRMERYQSAAAQAKGQGEERKTRMHQRIVKQYQDAIRAHKAGRAVNLSDLPVPPGFPPIQGTEGSAGDQSIMGVLETAMKLANQDEEEGEGGEGGVKPAARPAVVRPVGTAQARTPPQHPQPRGPPAGGPVPVGQGSAKAATKLQSKAQQQLDFLEGRKRQLMQAALRSKQKNDLEGAKQHLRHAKGMDPLIQAASGGLPVDISKVPAAPVNEEDFVLVQKRGVQVSHRAAEQYSNLMDLLKQQHEKCMSYSKQFTHLGNVSETSRFERMAEECKKHMEILKHAHGKGYPVPKFHHEERTFNIIKIFPNLTNSDMILTVMKGINLPAPQGVSSSELNAFVQFEFAFPSSEEAQRDRTSTVKNTNSPEFNEKFKLIINRSHRAFKRVVQSKGIKLEVFHKGGLFKTDRVVGSAQLKLDNLENKCEIREIIEVLDGRKPTGGRLDVAVQIREPLGGQQLESVTEKWVVIDPLTLPPVAVPTPKPKSNSVKDVNSREAYKFHSLSLLNYDKERAERKIVEYKRAQREPPRDLLQSHREVSQRIQWQRNQLERAEPGPQREYEAVLDRLAQGLGDSVKRFSSEGNREAAKDALYRLRLVESEMQNLRRKRPA